MPSRSGSLAEPVLTGSALHQRDRRSAPVHTDHATAHSGSVPTWAASDVRMARRSRLASIFLVLVLLGLSAFAVWSAQITAVRAQQAAAASSLSDEYAQAARAVAAQESSERKYRLEPGTFVRSQYDAAAREMLAALTLVARDGNQSDRTQVETVRASHRRYLEATSRLFRAVDRGDSATVLKIDNREVDPLFAGIERTVDSAANARHQDSVTQLADLRRLEMLTGWLTPVLFVVGLLLAFVLTSVTSGHRRLLDTERRLALHSSLHDALTGLPNRALLFDRFAQALSAAKRSGMAAGLLVIDLNRFKEINETFGHPYGDTLLTQIGPRLRSVLREADTVARLGGDEFAILLPDIADLSAATVAAGELLTALETPFVVEGVALDLEASVGVVLSGQHGSDPTTLLQRADIALQTAKAQNLGVAAYDPDLDGHSPAKLSLLGELRRALNLGQLVLHYQPKVSFRTGEVVGAEALVRWQHPGGGLIRPDAFIPMAERTALIGPLTTYVLGAALAQARTWMDAGQPLMVSVNLSARNLLDERLPQQVADLLAAHGVPARLLELEVTESALMTEPNRARRLLEALAGLGVRLSIDDFGAGYTSLGQLKNLPVTELKIDRSFVMNLSQDPRDALIVRSIIDLGHNLGLTIVAEGVETASTFADLTAFGCDTAQGYFVSRPSTAAVLDTWRSARPPVDAGDLDELSLTAKVVRER